MSGNNRFLQSNVTTTDLASETTLKDLVQTVESGLSVTVSGGTNITQLGGNAINLGSDAAGAGTQRMVLTNDYASTTNNNVARINGNTIAVGQGSVGYSNFLGDVQRVVLSDDFASTTTTAPSFGVGLGLSAADVGNTTDTTQRVVLSNDYLSTTKTRKSSSIPFTQQLLNSGNNNAVGDYSSVSADFDYTFSADAIITSLSLLIQDGVVFAGNLYGSLAALPNGVRLFFDNGSRNYLTTYMVDNDTLHQYSTSFDYESYGAAEKYAVCRFVFPNGGIDAVSGDIIGVELNDNFTTQSKHQFIIHGYTFN